MKVIAVTGVHGSGKTTFVDNLRQQCTTIGKSVYVVEEVARSCPYKLGTIDAQRYIYHNQCKREEYAIKQDVDIVLLDRMRLDNLVYYNDLLVYGEYPDSDALHWWEFYDEATACMSMYNAVIRLPLNLEYLKADDPMRSKSVEYAKRIDFGFDVLVEPYVTHHGTNFLSC